MQSGKIQTVNRPAIAGTCGRIRVPELTMLQLTSNIQKNIALTLTNLGLEKQALVKRTSASVGTYST